MIKVLCDKALEFSRSNPDVKDGLERATTSIGFNELPDWVEEDDYFKLNQSDGTIKAFTSSINSEEVAKAKENLDALKAEEAALAEKIEALKEKGNTKAADIKQQLADAQAELDALNEEIAAKKKGK